MHHIARRVQFSLYGDKLSVGDTASFGTDQIYTLVKVDSSDSGRGEKLLWRAHCQACGTPFEVNGARITNGLNRNCPAHRTRIPGKRKTADNDTSPYTSQPMVHKPLPSKLSAIDLSVLPPESAPGYRYWLYALEAKHTTNGKIDRQAYLKEIRALRAERDSLI